LAQPPGASNVPEGPAPTRVPVRGMPGRFAAVIVVGALGVMVAVGLAAQGGDQPRDSRAGLGVSTVGPTATATATATATPTATATATGDTVPTTPDSEFPGSPCTLVAPTAATPLPDVAGALPGDDGSGPLALGAIDTLPNEDRLDFLFEGGGCFRDAHWIDPENPGLGSGPWVAGRPFHVREGFINDGAQPLGEGFDVVIYVTRLGIGDEPTFRYTSDYVLRGTTDRCGPTYRTQSEARTCEWFVHDFADGLPEGRHAMWAAWEAPCAAWGDLGFADSCVDPDQVISLFSSGFDSPFDLSEPVYSESSAY
jgi:hypothetical protein